MNSLEATTAIKLDMPYPSIDLSSRRSSQSTSTVDDEQYELARRFMGPLTNELAVLSSPEMVSSATSLSSAEDESNEPKPVIDGSGHFEPVQITAEQADLLEEASDMSWSTTEQIFWAIDRIPLLVILSLSSPMSIMW